MPTAKIKNVLAVVPEVVFIIIDTIKPITMRQLFQPSSLWRQIIRNDARSAKRNAVGTVASAILIGTAITQYDAEDDTDQIKQLQKQAWVRTSRLCQCDGYGSSSPFSRFLASKSRKTVSSSYKIDLTPLGEGAFGAVFLATEISSGEAFALKKMSKEYTDNELFQLEIDALLRIRNSGGHPNICGMRENFDEGGDYILVLDLIRGGEMFDHLIGSGPYSEADAARLVREIASALDFLHGIGLVHTDLKPENLMLSSGNRSDAVIKLVDFGGAKFMANGCDGGNLEGGTKAYLPAEAFERKFVVKPSMDLWALGIIVYVMLVGCHPFDSQGDASDNDLKRRITTEQPLLADSPFTEHLSPSAIDLLRMLMEKDPSKRITAHKVLQHPWVRGKTARTHLIAESDKKLSKYRKFKSKIEAKIFADFVQWSEEDGGDKRKDEINNKKSLIEREFQSLDKENKGFLTTEDLDNFKCQNDGDDERVSLSLSGFSELLSDSMKSRYHAKNEIIMKEVSAEK